MILRLTLFISLLTLFYFYCNQNESVNNYRETNDINMIDTPPEISPTLNYEAIPQASLIIDSTYYSVFLPNTDFQLSSKISGFFPRNY